MIGIIIFLCLILLLSVGFKLKQRYFHKWIFGYVYYLIKKLLVSSAKNRKVHILFAFVDHFEPGHGKVTEEAADVRMDTWCTRYPEMSRRHKDSDGCFPKHTWFYPPHYYNKKYFNQLNELVYDGFGEIEFHLHHGNDTADSLTDIIKETMTLYSRHGIFVTTTSPVQTKYAFIHGDWALDNSREKKHCGVNNELQILRETGCFVDMTFPSLHSAQPQKINSIYYAKDNPEQPKSYNWGKDVSVNSDETGDLMLIQGPLSINWKDWHHKFYPAFETGEVVAEYAASKKRIDFWIDTHIHVKGKPEWIFVKVHTHGAVDKDHETLLGKARDELHSYLESKYNDQRNYELHYVSAREMYNIVKAAEAGLDGNPREFRDFLIPPYANMKIKCPSYYKLESYNNDSATLQCLEEYSEFEFKDFFMRRISGKIKNLEYSQSKDGLNIILTATGPVTIDLDLPGKAIECSDGDLSSSEDGGYVLILDKPKPEPLKIKFENAI